MMKKIFVLFIFGICTLATNAQVKIDNLFDDLSKYENVERVHIGSFLMTICKPFLGSSEDAEMVRKVNSITVLDASDASKSVRKSIRECVDQLDYHGYDLLVRVKEERDDVRIFVKQDKDAVRELLILVMGEDTCLVRIRGKLDISDVDEFVDKYSDNEKRKI